MNKTWKWVLGIVVGLVVVAALVGAGFWVVNRSNAFIWMRDARQAQRGDFNWRQPGQELPQLRGQGQKSPRDFGNNRMPMYSYNMMGFHPFGGLLLIGRLVGGAFKLALLGLVIFLAVVLAQRRQQPRPPAPAAAIPEAEPAAKLACPHCARTIQEDFRHCPYCGASLEAAQPEPPLA